MAHEAGKGSGPRPFSVSTETFADNWERIFGKKDNKEPAKSDQEADTKEETNTENKK